MFSQWINVEFMRLLCIIYKEFAVQVNLFTRENIYIVLHMKIFFYLPKPSNMFLF